MVENVTYRTCGHEYEVDTPAVMVSCIAGPEGKCGAFAVGRCADCDRDVCRYHATYIDGRLLCDDCGSRVLAAHHAEEADRAEIAAVQAAEQDAERQRQEREQLERQAIAEAEAVRKYRLLSPMTDDDWVNFLRGAEDFDVSDAGRPCFDGRRSDGELSATDLARILDRGRFPLHDAIVGYKTRMGGRRSSKPIKGQVWVVGEERRQYYNRGEGHAMVWICLAPDGQLFEEGPVHASSYAPFNLATGSSWRPTIDALTDGRRLLTSRTLEHKLSGAGPFSLHEADRPSR
jgi:DNA-directed RNA polymerase subunit RPC12/RpoP